MNVNLKAKNRVVTAEITNQKDIDLANTTAHEKLAGLLDSLIGRAYFTGDAAVAIVDDTTIIVSAELRQQTDFSAANQALQRVFAAK